MSTKVSIDVEKRLDAKRIDVELASMEYARVKKEYEDLLGE